MLRRSGQQGIDKHRPESQHHSREAWTDNNNSWHLLNLDWHFKGDEMGTQKRKRSAYIKSCQLR